MKASRKAAVIVLFIFLFMVLVTTIADASLALVVNEFGRGDADNWEIYEWFPGETRQIFHPVSIEGRRGVDDSGYAWSDDSRWDVDVPDSNSILALIVYPRHSAPFQRDLRDAAVSVSLRSESLDLKGGHVYFWVYNFETCTRYHYIGNPLTVGQSDWATQTFVIDTDPSHWLHTYTASVCPGGSPRGELDKVLGAVDSYGFSFRGFSSEVTGRLEMDEFSIGYHQPLQTAQGLTWRLERSLRQAARHLKSVVPDGSSAS